MEEIRPTGLETHTYRLKWWAQLWCWAWAAVTGGFGVIFIATEIAHRDWKNFLEWHTVPIWVLSPAMGCFFIVLALRSRVVLDGSRISVRRVRERSADMHEIVGYRIETARNGTFWRIELRNGEYLSVMRTFNVDDAFQHYLSQLKRLDDKAVPGSLFSN